VAPPSFLRFVNHVTYKLEMMCDVTFPEKENDINAST